MARKKRSWEKSSGRSTVTDRGGKAVTSKSGPVTSRSYKKAAPKKPKVSTRSSPKTTAANAPAKTTKKRAKRGMSATDQQRAQRRKTSTANSASTRNTPGYKRGGVGAGQVSAKSPGQKYAMTANALQTAVRAGRKKKNATQRYARAELNRRKAGGKRSR